MAGARLDHRALNRSLLARQLLLERSNMAPLEAIERLVGMQAQLPAPPYHGLLARLAGFRPEALSQLFLDRAVVRIALMRSTIHLVSAADCLWLRPVLEPVLRRGMTPGSPYGKALAGVDLEEVAALGRELVEATPMTGAEISAALQARWPQVDATALAFAVRSRVPLVQVPPRGLWGGVGQARCTSAEAWLGRPLAEPDVDRLVLRYLAAYGPASVRDAQAWSGLTGLGTAFSRLEDRLVRFRDESGVALFDLPDAPRPPGDSPAPVRLLPDFDGILLAHQDRLRMFDPDHKSLIVTVNGIIRASVLVDGFVSALWTVTAGKDGSIVTVRALPGASASVRRARDEVAAEAFRVLDITSPGLTHDVQFGEEVTAGTGP